MSFTVDDFPTTRTGKGFLLELAAVVQDMLATNKLGAGTKLSIQLNYRPSTEFRDVGNDGQTAEIAKAFYACIAIGSGNFD